MTSKEGSKDRKPDSDRETGQPSHVSIARDTPTEPTTSSEAKSASDRERRYVHLRGPLTLDRESDNEGRSDAGRARSSNDTRTRGVVADRRDRGGRTPGSAPQREEAASSTWYAPSGAPSLERLDREDHRGRRVRQEADEFRARYEHADESPVDRDWRIPINAEDSFDSPEGEADEENRDDEGYTQHERARQGGRRSGR